MELTWVEISKENLIHNLKTFRKLVGKDVVLSQAVKANAYGHGLIEFSKILDKNGVDYLCVNAPFEAIKLRKAGIKIPILIIGYTPLSDLDKVVNLKNVELIVYNLETVKKLGKIGKKIEIHLKIETGSNRQGIRLKDVPKFATEIKKYPKIILNGVSTHFANIEDRINHQYALYQLEELKKAIHLLEIEDLTPLYRHCANSAATLVLPESYFNFVRVGVSMYGFWPSKKTELAADRAGINIKLKPVMTWKTVVAQIKNVKKGSLIGYGCTHITSKNSKIAVLPVGYYDGYVRMLSNCGYVLIRGKKCPVVGRVCMNMIMVDVTHVTDIKLEDEVVLIGKQGRSIITAEEMGELSSTINYEVTTRVNDRIPRIIK